MTYKSSKPNTIVLCNRKNSCCPTIHFESGSVRITDDYGGCVKMTEDEFAILGEKLEEIFESRCPDGCACSRSN